MYFFTICSEDLLVNGKLIVILEKNPSGGYRTNGIDRDGLTTKVVPGGRASRPSDVIHKIRFCRECALFSVDVTAVDGAHCATRRHTAIRRHDMQTSILYLHREQYK